jgi:hypothetical protein
MHGDFTPHSNPFLIANNFPTEKQAIKEHFATKRINVATSQRSAALVFMWGRIMEYGMLWVK